MEILKDIECRKKNQETGISKSNIKGKVKEAKEEDVEK